MASVFKCDMCGKIMDHHVNGHGREEQLMTSRFFQNGELKDAKIVAALRQAATQYENGEIVEVYDTLIDIMSAIEDFDKRMEAQLG